MDSLADNAYQFYLDPAFPAVDFTSLPDLSQVLNDPYFMDNDRNGNPPKQKTRIRAAKACLACRSRHMKCDAVEPKCSRCQIDDKSCMYTKSRRGGSHRTSPGNGNSLKSFPTTPNVGHQATTGQKVDSGFPSHNELASPSENDSFNDTWSETSGQGSGLMNIFYEYFHPSHTFILPRRQLCLRRDTDSKSLDLLIPVIEYLGSVYKSGLDSSPYKQVVDELLAPEELPGTPFTVQALILYSLARQCSDEYEDAEANLDRAVDMAMSLGMDRKDFATQNGQGDNILEESLRRTWWTLFMLDAVFAAISHRPIHRLQHVTLQVDLPCEDCEYESGNIPRPRTIEEYDNREFNDEEIVFSSMTYLIDTMRIASAIVPNKNARFSPGSRTVMAGDAKIVNWFLYLPECKRDVVRFDGSVDETMFLAHVCINTEKLQLHRPQSALVFSDIETRSKCTPPADLRQARDAHRSVILHTAKALEATSSAIMLFALPTPMIKHSPLVTCALALAVMAQVSACKYISKVSSTHLDTPEQVRHRAEAYQLGRDRVRLGLGALKGGMNTWGLARRSIREVVGISRELLAVANSDLHDSESSAGNSSEVLG